MTRIVSWITITGFVVTLLVAVASSQDNRGTADGEDCSLASLKGAYGFYRTGTAAAGPLAAVGITTFDGRGGAATQQTIRVNGVTTELFTDGSFDATYSVSPDCSAVFINPDGSVFGQAVVVDGGKEVFILSMSGENTIAGVMKRIKRIG